MGDLASRYSDAIGTQVHYTYGVSDMFGFDASFGYSSHSATDLSNPGKYSLTTLLTGMRANLSWYDRVIPYAIAGLGFYKPSIPYGNGADANTTSPIVFGIHMGAGADLQLSQQIFFGASLTFHDIFGTTTPTSSGPVSVDGTYTSFLLHAGFSF